MKKQGRSRRQRVCLLSPHALALEEFERCLPDTEFVADAVALSLGESLAAGWERRLPPAGVYIVDGPASWPLTTPLVAALQERHPEARVLVVAEKFTESSAFPLLRLGVKGLLRYAETRERLAAAVRTVAGNGFWVPRVLLSRFVDRILTRTRGRSLLSGPAGLSRRERDVLEALLENLSNKEIATRLSISERTVKFHVSNLLAKFDVRRRADLIVLCAQGGLLVPQPRP